MKKKLFLITLLTFGLFQLSKAQEMKIATIGSSGITFVVSQTTLLGNWNTNLTNLTGISASLNSINIVLGADNNYYAVATGSQYTSTSTVVVVGNDIYAYMTNNYTITCTSKDCSQTSGCIPTDGGKCTNCSGDCTKTTTMGGSIMSQ